MCILHIHLQCYNRFFEIKPEEKENAELFLEDMVSHVLLDLFGEGIVDDVTIQFSSGLPMGLHHCSIAISAQCACQGFVLRPRSQEHMKRVIEQNITSILKELFVTVQVDTVVLRPSQCEYDATLSCRI